MSIMNNIVHDCTWREKSLHGLSNIMRESQDEQARERKVRSVYSF